jgi:hypothetical protein
MVPNLQLSYLCALLANKLKLCSAGKAAEGGGILGDLWMRVHVKWRVKSLGLCIDPK